MSLLSLVALPASQKVSAIALRVIAFEPAMGSHAIQLDVVKIARPRLCNICYAVKIGTSSRITQRLSRLIQLSIPIPSLRAVISSVFCLSPVGNESLTTVEPNCVALCLSFAFGLSIASLRLA